MLIIFSNLMEYRLQILIYQTVGEKNLAQAKKKGGTGPGFTFQEAHYDFQLYKYEALFDSLPEQEREEILAQKHFERVGIYKSVFNSYFTFTAVRKGARGIYNNFKQPPGGRKGRHPG